MMPLPTKSYFFLGELSEAWGAALADFACYAQEGRLEISVMTVGTAAVVHEAAEADGPASSVNEPICLHGPQPLRPGDAWIVFSRGAARIHGFTIPEPGRTVRLNDPAGLEVKVSDLLVTRAERERFERQYGLSEATNTVSQINHPAFSHSVDYSLVTLAGQSFAFGPRQAAIVRLLHESHDSGKPWVPGADLLSGARAGSDRLVDLFKSQPNWRSLIVSDNRGNWRLNLPDRAARRMSAFRRPYLRLVN